MQTDGFLDAFVSLLAVSGGRVTTDIVRHSLTNAGLNLTKDPRLGEINRLLPTGHEAADLDLQQFSDLMAGDGGMLMMNGLRGDLAIPDFVAFSRRVERIFNRVKEGDPIGSEVAPPAHPPSLAVLDRSYPAAQNADYIPALSNAEDGWAVSICTVDGQQVSFGDLDRRFSIQSCCKPINYCQAMETFNRGEHGVSMKAQETTAQKRRRLAERGEARKVNRFEKHESEERVLGVHDFIDCEPSGDPFNAFSFNDLHMPYNPMINAGAIMCASLVSKGGPTDIELEQIQSVWRGLAGGSALPLPDTTTAKGESRTGANNRSIAYKLFANEAFPAFIKSAQDVENVLDFYFHCCSLMLTTCEMAAAAATLSNRGVNPITGERVFSAGVVKQCLASMVHCGMYDSSGRFGRIVGLPAKSGVGGGILLVVPGVMGICTFSPRLDKVGNSLRGLAFIESLVEEYALHMLDAQTELSHNYRVITAPEVRSFAQPAQLVISAGEIGDIGAFERFKRVADSPQQLRGFLDIADYDGRRAAHLAACGDHTAVLRFLFEHGADPAPKDRWGSTPLDDAKRHGNTAAAGLLEDKYKELELDLDTVEETLDVVGPAELELARSQFHPEELPHRSSAIEDIEVIWAAARGDVPFLRRLAARGARLLIADYDDRTPLHLAAAEGHDSAVAFLVEYFRQVDNRREGSDDSSRLAFFLSWPDRWGRSPLDEAELNAQLAGGAAQSRCVDLLEEAGAIRFAHNHFKIRGDAQTSV